MGKEEAKRGRRGGADQEGEGGGERESQDLGDRFRCTHFVGTSFLKGVLHWGDTTNWVTGSGRSEWYKILNLRFPVSPQCSTISMTAGADAG